MDLGSKDAKAISAEMVREVLLDPHGVIVVAKIKNAQEELPNTSWRTGYDLQNAELLTESGTAPEKIWNWKEAKLRVGAEYILFLHSAMLQSETDVFEVSAKDRTEWIRKVKEWIKAGTGPLKPNGVGAPKLVVKPEAATPDWQGPKEWAATHTEISKPPIYFTILQKGGDFALVRVLGVQVFPPGHSGMNEPTTEYEVMILQSLLDRELGPRRVNHLGSPVLEVGREYLANFSYSGSLEIETGCIPIPVEGREVILDSYRQRIKDVRHIRETGGDIYQIGIEPRALSDSQIRETLAVKPRDIIWVKIVDAKEQSQNTRSFGTSYTVEPIETLLGRQPQNPPKADLGFWAKALKSLQRRQPPSKYKYPFHYGAQALKIGAEYILVIVGGFGGEIPSPYEGAVRVPEQGREAFVQKHREAILRLTSEKGGK